MITKGSSLIVYAFGTLFPLECVEIYKQRHQAGLKESRVKSLTLNPSKANQNLNRELQRTNHVYVFKPLLDTAEIPILASIGFNPDRVDKAYIKITHANKPEDVKELTALKHFKIIQIVNN